MYVLGTRNTYAYINMYIHTRMYIMCIYMCIYVYTYMRIHHRVARKAPWALGALGILCVLWPLSFRYYLFVYRNGAQETSKPPKELQVQMCKQ